MVLSDIFEAVLIYTKPGRGSSALPAQPPSPVQRDFSPPALDVLTAAVLGPLPRVEGAAVSTRAQSIDRSRDRKGNMP